MIRALLTSAMYAMALLGSLVGLEESPKPPGPLSQAIESPVVTGAVVRESSPSTTAAPVALTLPRFGDERREPLPRRAPVPVFRQSSPDWRCDGWMEMARRVGWLEEELPRLSYTIYRESRCRPDQHNPDDPMGGSNGLTQINQFWCKPTRYWPDGWLQAHGILEHCDELYDPKTSLTASLAIWENSGWSPWFP